MNNFKKVLCSIFAMLLMVVALTACGEQDPIVGRWGESDERGRAYFEFRSDGTGEAVEADNFSRHSEAFTWQRTGNDIISSDELMRGESEFKVEFTLNGRGLILSRDAGSGERFFVGINLDRVGGDERLISNWQRKVEDVAGEMTQNLVFAPDGVTLFEEQSRLIGEASWAAHEGKLWIPNFYITSFLYPSYHKIYTLPDIFGHGEYYFMYSFSECGNFLKFHYKTGQVFAEFERQ